MFKLSVFICIITQLCNDCPPVYCEDINDSSSLGKDVEIEIDSEPVDHDHFSKSIDDDDPTKMVNFIDPHSLFYDRHSKQVIDDTESFVNYKDKVVVNSPVKQDKETLVLRESSEDCHTFKVYYKRLILMLLSNANLQMENGSVEGQLFIKGTYDQIETLKNLDIGHYSVKEIDLLLSEIISTAPYYNYFIHVPTLFDIVGPLLSLWDYYVEIVAITTMTIVIIILLRTMPLFQAVNIIVVALFTISFYMTWWHLMKEAEIKLAVTQVQYTEMPAACQPHKMSFWDQLKSYMFDNKECEKYVEARMSNPKLGVTPALVLSHMFASVALQPVAIVGETISKFISNSTAHLNWLSGPVQLILYLCLPAFFVILVFALRGGSINFGLGPLFRFSFATHGGRGTSIADSHKRQTIELIREVLAEVPANATLSLTGSTKSTPLPITNIIQEDNSSTDNSSKDNSSKLISNESKKERICGCGDSVQNDLLSEEIKKTSEECIGGIKTETVQHTGGGDA